MLPSEFARQFCGRANKVFSLHFTYVLANVANAFTSQFSPKRLPTSPGTPHKVMHTLNDFCLICDCSSKQGKGEVIVHFNAVRSCPGLSRVLGRDVRPNKSQRICRKCKTKTESAVKKINTGKRLITELKSCYEKASMEASKRIYESSNDNVRVKHLAKQSPSTGDLPARQVKIRQPTSAVKRLDTTSAAVNSTFPISDISQDDDFIEGLHTYIHTYFIATP